MRKIQNFFSKEKEARLDNNSRCSSTGRIARCSFSADTQIDIFRFLPRKVLCQQIQATNSLIFRLCNSEKVPNIHRIQLILTYSYLCHQANYPFKESANTSYGWKIFPKSQRSPHLLNYRYNIYLNPTQQPLDLITFSQLPQPKTRNIRFSRVAITVDITPCLFYQLSKVKHMFEGCRLEIQNSCGRITSLQIKQLFDNIQISECEIFSCNNYVNELAALITLTPVLEADILEILGYQTFYFWNSYFSSLVEWLHHREALINARRHCVFKREVLEYGHSWERFVERFNAFLDLVVQKFQSAELPCNFMITWSCSIYVKPTDLFNENTKERLSIFQRESEPNIFRLWRRPSTLDDFHKLLPSAANKTVHGNIWEDPFYYHRSTETLHKTADIPTLPLGRSTTRRQQRFKILCKTDC